jgi:signal peptidase II
VLLLLVVVGAGADLWTKHVIFAWRGLPGEKRPWWIIQDIFGIETSVNIGAVFGLGAGHGRLFAVLSVIAFVAISTWLFRFGAIRSTYLLIALGCVLGGIIGNLYDRLGLWYQTGMPPEWKTAVRDWILMRVNERYTWPNYNIADSLLVVGAVMLFIHSFRTPAEPKQSGGEERG